MVFGIIGINAVDSKNNFPVPLVCVNGAHTDASVGVNSRENQSVRLRSRSYQEAIQCVLPDEFGRIAWANYRAQLPGLRRFDNPVPLIVMRIPLVFISRKASRRSGSNSWRTQITGCPHWRMSRTT